MSWDRRRQGLHNALLMGVILWGSVGGCRKSEPSISVHELAGTILSVDVEDRKLTLQFRAEDSGEMRTIEGTVPADAEIVINDRPAKLADIRIGEFVNVVGSLERRGNERTVTALKISVTRDETVTFGGKADDPGD